MIKFAKYTAGQQLLTAYFYTMFKFFVVDIYDLYIREKTGDLDLGIIYPVEKAENFIFRNITAWCLKKSQSKV